MAKVLISSLGTGSLSGGEYRKTTYKLNGENKTYETSFIAYALHQYIGFDTIYLVGTNKSIWDEAYNVFSTDPDAEIWEKLNEKKEEANIAIKDLKVFKEIHPTIIPKIIKYGIDEEELWDNFETYIQIANELHDGDEIYLDITHSFRSLALFSYVMTQFAQAISNKKIHINAVYYGMFEYAFDNNNITPIVDIKMLLDIQEWIKAIDAIKKYSDFDLLNELLEQEEDIEKVVKNSFKDLDNTIKMANMASMKRFVSSARKKLNSISKSQKRIIQLIAPEIKKIINELDREKLSDFQFALAKWFYKNKNYAMSYLALFEAVISKTVELKEPNEDIYNEKIRNSIKGRIDYPYNKLFLENKGKKSENLNSVSSIRHSIAHQLSSRQDTVTQDIKRLKQYLDEFDSYFSNR